MSTQWLRLFFILSVLLLGKQVASAVILWDAGGVSNLWSEPENWSNDVVPGETDSVWINLTGDFARVDASVSAEAFQFIIGRNDDALGATLEVTGGSITSNDVFFVGQYAGADGVLVLSNGAVTSESEMAIGVSGTGTLLMTGGTIDVATSFKVGRYPTRASSVGNVRLHGGVIQCASFAINRYSNMDIANGGTLIVDGDDRANINNCIAGGEITAAGGSGTVDVDFDQTNAGKTTVTTTATASLGAMNPMPEDGVTEVDVDTDLSWSSSDGVAYDVYLGKLRPNVQSANRNSDEYLGKVTSKSFNLDGLDRGFVYFWRVDELDASNNVISTGQIWCFEADAFDADDLGDTEINYNFSGVRSVGTAPATGVHPRIFFSPNDISGIRSRLSSTNAGREVAAQIDAYMTLMDLGADGGCHSGGYCPDADYALDSLGRPRIQNIGLFDVKDVYDDLVNGNASSFNSENSTRRILIGGMLAIRAFDRLMDNDNSGLSEVGDAIATYAEALKTDGSDIQSFLHLAYAYDMAYNRMSASERDIVVQKISEHLEDHIFFGTYEEAYATTSNWVALTSFWSLAYMAIEGENPDLDSLVYDGAVRATYNFLTYGWHPSGVGFEGLGKNYVYATSLIAYARRGETYLGHPYLKAYAEKFLPATVQPFGYAFSAYDSLAGSGVHPDPIRRDYYRFNEHDAIGLKWIFPNSSKMDFVWRNYVTDDYDMRIFEPRGHDNPLLVAAIFASDYSSGGAWSSSGIPLSFFAGDRGLMHTRSDTTRRATSLEFHCRQDFGGHTNADRLNFNLSALGRAWCVYRTEVNGGPTGNPHESKYHSTIMINNKGIEVNPKDGVKARQPGAVLSYEDTAEETTIVGDATYAYTWEFDWDNEVAEADDPRLNSSWTRVEESLNDFRFTPGDEAYFDIPLYDFAAWRGYPLIERMAKRESLPMDYIYRTASLLRGEHPYVLILDDVKLKGGETNQFSWQIQLPDDLSVESTDVDMDDSDYRYDIILKEPDTVGSRRLLVRVLQNDGYTGTPGFIRNRIEPRREIDNWPALVVRAMNSGSPNFKVMLYPHYDGDELPTTSWNGSTLNIDIDGQVDVYNFSKNSDGLTEFSRQRTDMSPPNVPKDLFVVDGNDKVDLYWGDNTESDFDSYTVYRSTSSGGSYTVLEDEITSHNYSDTTAENGTMYYYVITSLDDDGNESDFSEELIGEPNGGTQTICWDEGGANSFWTTASNWHSNSEPRSVDNVWFNIKDDYGLIRNGNQVFARQLIVSRSPAAQNVELEMTGGELMTSNVFFIGQYVGSDGKLTMSGGTLSVGSEMAVATAGNGALQMTGGALHVRTAFRIGRYEREEAAGQVELHGGSITCGSFGMNSFSELDIEEGKLIIDGNRVDLINGYIAEGRIQAYGGSGELIVEYDTITPGKTTVIAAP